MADNKRLTAEQAYAKTKELLESYANGDCLGGNPMCWIEEFADQQTTELKEELNESNKLISYAAESKFKQEAKYDKLKAAADKTEQALEKIRKIVKGFDSEVFHACNDALQEYEKLK